WRRALLRSPAISASKARCTSRDLTVAVLFPRESMDIGCSLPRPRTASRDELQCSRFLNHFLNNRPRGAGQRLLQPLGSCFRFLEPCVTQFFRLAAQQRVPRLLRPRFLIILQRNLIVALPRRND